jgi:hypothetical protein
MTLIPVPSASTSTAVATTIASESQPPLVDELNRFQLVRGVIEHEDNLLNQRVSWIILAQSFSMAAFITTPSDHNPLRYIMAAVGLATVLVTMPAILAAGQNIEVKQQLYFKGISSDERCVTLHGHDRSGTMKVGESELRLSKGHLFPNTSFRGEFGVPILLTVIALAAVQVVGWISLLLALIMGWETIAMGTIRRYGQASRLDKRRPKLGRIRGRVLMN